ncbi:hypothetical protein FD755_017647, partial [Muntiacus reevesi]
PHLGSRETQADLSQDLEGSGGQEGGMALNGEVLESGGEEAEDETVQLPGTPGCKSYHYLMVQTPNILRKAQQCQKCNSDHFGLGIRQVSSMKNFPSSLIYLSLWILYLWAIINYYHYFDDEPIPELHVTSGKMRRAPRRQLLT